MEAGRLDVVVAQEWPRLERNRSEGVRIIETSMRHKVTLAFVKGLDIDTQNAEGRFVADLLSGLARREIEVKSERQSAAQVQRANQGRPPKGTRPLGYAVSGEQIPHEAQAVRAIFNAFEAGASLFGIARALSGADMFVAGQEAPAIPNIPTLPRHDRSLAIERNAKRVELNQHLPKEQQYLIRDVPPEKPWTHSTVLGVLRNPRYAGFSTYRKKSQRPQGHSGSEAEFTSRRRAMRDAIVRDANGKPVPPSGWSAIVPEGQWWNVQAMLDDDGRRTNRVGTERRHTGSGLYRCGVCEEPVRSHSKLYACKEGHVNRSRALIDDFVDKAIRARLARADLKDLLPKSEDAAVQAIVAAADRQRADIERARDDYQAHLIDGVMYRRIKDQADTEIARLDNERARLTSGAAASGVMAARDPTAAFETADLASRRAVIAELCEVHLFPHPRGKKGIGEPRLIDDDPHGRQGIETDTLKLFWRK
jgi:site-specific DNA recombinase